MAIDISGSSPALGTGNSGDSVTSDSFTRPAAALLVAMVMGLSDDPFTVSGGSLTWTRRVQRADSVARVEIWTAPVTGSGSMTVTAAGTGGYDVVALKVDAVTGQHASPIGNTGNNASTSNTLSVTGYTSSAAGSRGFFAACESNGLGSPTVQGGDTGFPWTDTFGLLSGIAIRKASNTVSSGTAVTFGADAPGSGAADWIWCALEIKPAITSVDASVTAETVAVATTMPDPAVSASASTILAAVAAAAALPAPDVSASSQAHPDTIAVAADVPVPSVTTENAEIVELATVETSADIPDPAIAVSSNATLAAVDAVVQMYAPAIQADAHITLSTVAVLAGVHVPTVTVPVLPGDQITRAGQIEWDGTLLGSGTPYSWQDLQGWIDSAPFISGNVDRPDSSGSYPGQPYTAERVINWATLLKAPRDTIGQIVHDLVMATGPAQSADEGWLVVWDFDDVQPWLVRAHLSDRKPGPIDRNARLGLMRGGLQWTASDPRRYDPVRSSLTIAKDTPTSILNNGNDATPGELRFVGPCTAPQVENLTNDLVIAFDTVIGSDQTLVINVKEGLASIGDTDHVDDLIEGSTSIQDFVFAPGANELLFTCDSGGSAGMETFWRHAVS